MIGRYCKIFIQIMILIPLVYSSENLFLYFSLIYVDLFHLAYLSFQTILFTIFWSLVVLCKIDDGNVAKLIQLKRLESVEFFIVSFIKNNIPKFLKLLIWGFAKKWAFSRIIQLRRIPNFSSLLLIAQLMHHLIRTVAWDVGLHIV